MQGTPVSIFRRAWVMFSIWLSKNTGSTVPSHSSSSIRYRILPFSQRAVLAFRNEFSADSDPRGCGFHTVEAELCLLQRDERCPSRVEQEQKPLNVGDVGLDMMRSKTPRHRRQPIIILAGSDQHFVILRCSCWICICVSLCLTPTGTLTGSQSTVNLVKRLKTDPVSMFTTEPQILLTPKCVAFTQRLITISPDIQLAPSSHYWTNWKDWPHEEKFFFPIISGSLLRVLLVWAIFLYFVLWENNKSNKLAKLGDAIAISNLKAITNNMLKLCLFRVTGLGPNLWLCRISLHKELDLSKLL